MLVAQTQTFKMSCCLLARVIRVKPETGDYVETLAFRVMSLGERSQGLRWAKRWIRDNPAH